ncbi:MAG: alpha/beta hydrolase family protein [Gemmatimonadaceae bacterium]
MRATPHLIALAALLVAAPMFRLAAQASASVPAAPFRGTLSLGDRVVPIQIRGSQTAEARFQIAAPLGFDDTTSRPMRRDPRGDTLLAVIPGFGDTLRFAPRLDGESLRGTIRQGERTGTFALHRVVDLPLDVIKPRVGDYRLDDGALFSVGGGENAFDGLTYIHFGTGRTGSLFAVDSSRFVAGPRRYDSDPVNYTVQFEPGDRILISSAEGRRWRGRRTVFFREQDVSFPTTGGVQLAGTFTVPTTRGPHPAVIMLHGSEPNYRFRGNVVTFFASRGIAVLSWDKRGNFGSGGTLQTSTIDTLAADGAAAIRWLRARPEIDPRRVGVWGISQGGWPASILAARDSSLAFVILHAGSSLTPATQGDDEMRLTVAESGGTPGAVDTLLAYYHLYNDVLRGRATRASLDSMHAALRAQGNRFIWSPANSESPRARWLAGIMDFDPVPYWSRARVPVLALFGEFDGYVPPETNVPVLREAFARSGNRDTSIVVFPRANHRFEESSRRMIRDWVIGSRYLPAYYDTMAAWLDRFMKRH